MYKKLYDDIIYFVIIITIIQFMYWLNSLILFPSFIYFILFLLCMIIALLFYHLIFSVIIKYKKDFFNVNEFFNRQKE